MNAFAMATAAASSSVRFVADYEFPVKPLETDDRKAFYAYIIEQGDLLIKKICMCMPKAKCLKFDSVKLAE